ncbi:MAG: SH3 domain-containing protein [Candidatus Margulisiibacteriota bacterium]
MRYYKLILALLGVLVCGSLCWAESAGAAAFNASRQAASANRLGPAVYHIQTAYRQDPWDADIRAFRSQLLAHVPEDRRGSGFYLEASVQWITEDQLRGLFGVVLSCVSLGLGWLWYGRGNRVLAQNVVGIALGATVLVGGLWGLKAVALAQHKAIVLRPATLFNGPGPNRADIEKLPEGTVLACRTETKDWVEIITETGTIGWVKQQSLKRLNQ